MGRKIFSGLLALCILCTPMVSHAFQPVLDATNAGHLVNILGETRRQYRELQGMSTQIENMNGRLGGVLPNTTANRLAQLNMAARDWGHYIDALSSPGTHGLSLLSTFGFQNFGLKHGDRINAMGEFLSEKLYPASEEPVSYQKLEDIKQVRTEAVKSSTVQGVAMAGDKKYSLHATQRKIAELGSEALRAPTIHDDLMVTNKLLTLIAQELTQQRELLAHQLELLSSVVTYSTPLVQQKATGRN
ncbi:MAG TPA: hypothetical protein PK583_01575 [Gammaproteobacteria bacterium]|nr:hypothetical protein [Gammaproteobacteria bacterium]